MRILSVSVHGIGGLADGTVSLPDASVFALAGGNGTGKSKLLACLLSPWSQTIPTARSNTRAYASVTISLTPEERRGLQQFGSARGWGDEVIPESVSVNTISEPLVGTQRSSYPPSNALAYGWSDQNLIQACPSLDIVFLPAERRLVQSGSTGIDLDQLSELISLQKTAEPRQAVQNYGRLDDQEFEQFAKALCVAASLPDEEGVTEATPAPRLAWPTFEATVNSIITPKKLLRLSRQHPDTLRILTPSGDTHSVQDLSSGERQALIIMSRVMRAGASSGTVLIDEPDAYLHPQLSQRLIQALESAVGKSGQLVVATHSPSILDSLPPSSIMRLGHGEAPRLVADEADRVELYRGAGFRASSLTQSDLLIVVEGETDQPLLELLIPELGRSSLRKAGGRAQVFQTVEQLHPFNLPVLGIVDGDVAALEPPTFIAHLITIWPTADIEGVFLSDTAALQTIVDLGLAQSEYTSIAALRELLDELLTSMKDNVVAELAQRQLRVKASWRWPSPRGDQAVDRLRSAALQLQSLSVEDVDDALSAAETTWNSLVGDDRWRLVRGKYLLNTFTARASQMRSGNALLEAVARRRPILSGVEQFRSRVIKALTQSTT